MTELPATGHKVFISYAHADNEPPDRWLDRILEHLHSVQLDVNESAWSDAKIGYGEDWHEQIQQSLVESKVAVLLISSAFLRSKYIRDHELPQLLEKRVRNELLIIPVVIRPCAFDEAKYRYPNLEGASEELFLSTLQTPTREPLSKLQKPQQDEILADLAIKIKQVLERPGLDATDEATKLDLVVNAARRKPLSCQLTIALLTVVFIALPVWWVGDLWRPVNIIEQPPSVLFANLSASDLERLRGATEIDVIRLAQECESAQIRQLAEVFQDRPKAMLSLVRLIVESPADPADTIQLSDSDRKRLASATEDDVIALAMECESELIRDVAEAFADQPYLVLEFIQEIAQ